jgi:hypothetical protein
VFKKTKRPRRAEIWLKAKGLTEARILTVPINGKPFQNEGGIIDLEDNQQKDQKQGHKNPHNRGGAPTGDDFAVFRVEGSENIAEPSTLCHRLSAESLKGVFLRCFDILTPGGEVIPGRSNKGD